VVLSEISQGIAQIHGKITATVTGNMLKNPVDPVISLFKRWQKKLITQNSISVLNDFTK